MRSHQQPLETIANAVDGRQQIAVKRGLRRYRGAVRSSDRHVHDSGLSYLQQARLGLRNARKRAREILEVRQRNDSSEGAHRTGSIAPRVYRRFGISPSSGRHGIDDGANEAGLRAEQRDLAGGKIPRETQSAPVSC